MKILRQGVLFFSSSAKCSAAVSAPKRTAAGGSGRDYRRSRTIAEEEKNKTPCRRRSSFYIFALTLLLLSAPYTPAFADRLITTSGKVLEGQIREETDKVIVQFENATLELPRKFVKQIEIEGDMSNYVPSDDREKEMLAKGFIKYRGQWMSKDRYLNELKAQEAAARKKLEDIRFHQQWGNEWKKETKHFEFHCNASPEILETYADWFEAFYDAYSERFNIHLSPTMSREKAKILIFRNEKEYLEYTKGEGTAGQFNPANKELSLYHDFDDPEYSRLTLFHEGTHLINYFVNPAMFGAIPIWLEESTAEYFSNVRLETKSGRIKVTPGEIAEDRLGVVQELIADGKPIPLQKLMTTPQDAFDADFYAFGWSFVHFLASHPKYGKGFLSFYGNLYRGKGMKFDTGSGEKEISDEEVIKNLLKYIGAKDLASLEKEWIAYARDTLKVATGRGDYFRVLAMDWSNLKKSGKSGKTAPAARLSPLELLHRAIDLRGYKTSPAYALRSLILELHGDLAKALEDMNRAIEMDPTQARLYAARAWLRNLDEKLPEAEKDLRLAVALDPEQPSFAEYLQKLLAKNWKEGPDRP